MALHPCADGLTKQCFKAYPDWARKAFAYKLLHILIPKQLTKNLPREMSTPFIAPGIILPPGADFPPGTIIAPDTTFPPGWTPEDQPPPGTTMPPTDSPVPPDTGAIPPTYVEVFGPGPVGGSTQGQPFDIGELLYDQGIGMANTPFQVGNVAYWSDLAMILENYAGANITAIDLQMGKHNLPTDRVRLEIWQTDINHIPQGIITAGTSLDVNGTSLPQFALNQDFIRFIFPNTPTIHGILHYDIVLARSGLYDPTNFYTVGCWVFGMHDCFYKLPDNTWQQQNAGYFPLKVWGFPL